MRQGPHHCTRLLNRDRRDLGPCTQFGTAHLQSETASTPFRQSQILRGLLRRELVRLVQSSHSRHRAQSPRHIRDPSRVCILSAALSSARALTMKPYHYAERSSADCFLFYVGEQGRHRHTRDKDSMVYSRPQPSRLRYPGQLRRDERYQQSSPREGVKIGRR